MRQYELLEAMTFKHGRFKLTPEQYANRRYVTRLVSEPAEMIVEPIAEISFKRGEIVTTDFPVPRALESKLRPLEAGTSPQNDLVASTEVAATDSPAGDPPTETTVAVARLTDDADPLADIPESPPDSGSAPAKRGRGR